MNIKFPRSTIFTVLMLLLSSVLSSTTKGLKRALGVNKAVLVFLLFFVQAVVLAQSIGDYQSKATGNWATASSWQICTSVSPLTWTTATNYPGQIEGSYAVLIQSGHTISIPNTGITTKTMGMLTISGSLSLVGDNTVNGINFIFNTQTVIVTPIIGHILFDDKVNFKLPENATLQVNIGGLMGDCSAQQSIYIDTLEYAVCKGNTADTGFTFEDVMNGGGTLNTTVSSNSPVCLGNTINFYGSYTGVKGASVKYSWLITAPGGGATTSTDQDPVIINAIEGTYTGKLTCSIEYKDNTYTNSETTIVTVNALPTEPTVTATQPTCTLPTGKITVNSPASGTGISYKVTGTNPVVASVTNNDGVFSGLTAGTYNVITTNSSGCISTPTSVTITSNAKMWNGSSNTDWNTASNWSPNGVPTSSDCVVIPKVTIAPVISGTNFIAYANTLTILDLGKLIVNSTNTINVIDFVDVKTDGSLTFENNSSLVQINDNAVNSGNITYKRTTPEILKTDYVYWSTPVADVKLEKIQTGTLYYSFNAAGPSWTRAYAGTTMITGMGYIVRGAGTWFDTGSVTLTPNFIGVPNNGVKTMGIVGGRSNLIGNPYPSAIDADAFILANINTNALSNSLSGSLYFWTHKSAIKLATEIRPGTAGSGAYAYTSDDYATYNLTGGTAGNKINVGKDTDPANKPSGKIAAGQAFFAAATAAGGIATFNNSMRLDKDKEALDNSQFFKPGSATKSSKSIEKNRVWLNLTNAEGAFKQTLIGYITGATNEYEGAYDGDSFNGNAYIDFYSINKDKNLVVQGRALPFDDNDTVPLGYKTTIVGEFKIAIDEADGFLANKKIILEDKLLDKNQDLSEAAYTFTTEKGTFNDRFVLSYANKTLATEDFEAVENRVMITNKNKEVKISTPENQIEAVFIYDILGRQIYTKTNVDKNDLVVTTLIARDQVLIVKVIMKDKSIITKKTIY